jgi:hypothetical protein
MNAAAIPRDMKLITAYKLSDMLKQKRTKIFPVVPSRGSPSGDAVHAEAVRKIGPPVPTDNTIKDLGGSKKMSVPNLSHLIDQKTCENDQLKFELDRERDRCRASYRARMYIAAEASRVVESLQQALIKFQELHKEIEEEQELNEY